jgi:CheY-like chemotaxis protein
VESLIVVLVVEDDHLIRSMAEETLSDGGYKLASASSAEQAIELLAGDNSIRALVTDIGLGSDTLTGWDVARRAREAKPEMPIVYMTGDHESDWASQGVPNSVLLAKPFAPAQLLTAVSHLLNAGSASTT